MTTLREIIRDVGERYIWGLSATDDTSSNSKVKRIGGSNDYSGNRTKDVDLELLRKIVISEPLIRKAIFKKNRDTFKNWFVIQDMDGNILSDRNYKIIRAFDKKTLFPNLLMQTGISANIYGTGFIEKIYNENSNTSSMSKITSRKNLIDLEILNSENIRERKKNPNNEHDSMLYPVYSKGNSGEKFIHPSRLEVVRIDKLPYSYFGISTVKILWNVLNSKMNADVSSGELLNWYGRGMYDIEIEGMTPEDENETKKQVKKHPDYLIHDEKVKVSVVNPTRIDPTPFYDYFYTNIAAGLEMPKHMLTGAEIGNVTGSEVGTSAYYSDIENTQKLVFTPIIENIYKELFRSFNKSWDYEIVWNPIFVDELSEAKILQTRSYSATQAANSGIVDTGEARKMLNQGIVYLDPDKKIESIINDSPKVSDPNVEPQPVEKRESDESIYTPFLTPLQKDMIERTKLKGKIEEELQEQRIREALEKMKNE